MAQTKGVYLEDSDCKAIERAARARKWSESQTMAEMIRSSELFKEFAPKTNKTAQPAGAD